MTIDTAVFLLSGYGTRLFPITKSIPKSMLHVVNKPLIQYVFDEVIEAGIRRCIFILNNFSQPLIDYFNDNEVLNAELSRIGQSELINTIRASVPRGVRCDFIVREHRQEIDHAICSAYELMNEKKPLLVIYPDELFDIEMQNPSKDLIDAYSNNECNIIAVKEVHKSAIGTNGIFDLEESSSSAMRIKNIYTNPDQINSEFLPISVGRYIYSPTWLDHTQQLFNKGEKINIGLLIQQAILSNALYAVNISSPRFDCGSLSGLFEANLYFYLNHPELKHSAVSIINKYSNLSDSR